MTKEDLLALHKETSEKCLLIMQAKNADYTAGSSDPFANFRASEILGVSAITGVLIRMVDKMQRLRSFDTQGTLAVKTESAEDACDDLVNYAILIKGLLRDKQQLK